ncbi:MAG: hypothetical protein LBE09_06545 [Christensenellaceae bacterium]|jgi:hypothetical protein|nr:hypothetical protein [Christensenellaceae bacterium]
MTFIACTGLLEKQSKYEIEIENVAAKKSMTSSSYLVETTNGYFVVVDLLVKAKSISRAVFTTDVYLNIDSVKYELHYNLYGNQDTQILGYVDIDTDLKSRVQLIFEVTSADVSKTIILVFDGDEITLPQPKMASIEDLLGL